MKKIPILIALALMVYSALGAQTVRHEHKYKGEQREYWLYLPENAGPGTPLVMLLHGHGGKAEGYCKDMLKVAQREGFAVCYPQGLKDSKADKSGWNVRYPVQEGLKRDDVDYVCFLLKHLRKEYGIAAKNAFLCGMSNGGEMCYIFAYRKPHTFNAIASIAGLTMQWLYKEYRASTPVAFMEVHGTADKTSMWEGDPTGKGGWGEYVAVPLAVGSIAAASRCTYTVDEPLPQKGENPVVVHRYLGCDPVYKGGPAAEVRLYEVQGGKHSWALKDMDTCEEAWNFFKDYMR